MICKFLKIDDIQSETPTIDFGGKVTLYIPYGIAFEKWLKKYNSPKNIKVKMNKIYVKPGAIIEINFGLMPGLPEDYYLLPTWLKNPNNFSLIEAKSYNSTLEGIILKFINITKKTQIIELKEPFVDMLIYKAKKVKVKSPKNIITYDGISISEFKDELKEALDGKETSNKSNI